MNLTDYNQYWISKMQGYEREYAGMRVDEFRGGTRPRKFQWLALIQPHSPQV